MFNISPVRDFQRVVVVRYACRIQYRKPKAFHSDIWSSEASYNDSVRMLPGVVSTAPLEKPSVNERKPKALESPQLPGESRGITKYHSNQ